MVGAGFLQGAQPQGLPQGGAQPQPPESTQGLGAPYPSPDAPEQALPYNSPVMQTAMGAMGVRSPEEVASYLRRDIGQKPAGMSASQLIDAATARARSAKESNQRQADLQYNTEAVTKMLALQQEEMAAIDKKFQDTLAQVDALRVPKTPTGVEPTIGEGLAGIVNGLVGGNWANSADLVGQIQGARRQAEYADDIANFNLDRENKLRKLSVLGEDRNYTRGLLERLGAEDRSTKYDLFKTRTGIYENRAARDAAKEFELEMTSIKDGLDSKNFNRQLDAEEKIRQAVHKWDIEKLDRGDKAALGQMLLEQMGKTQSTAFVDAVFGQWAKLSGLDPNTLAAMKTGLMAEAQRRRTLVDNESNREDRKVAVLEKNAETESRRYSGAGYVRNPDASDPRRVLPLDVAGPLGLVPVGKGGRPAPLPGTLPGPPTEGQTASHVGSQDDFDKYVFGDYKPPASLPGNPDLIPHMQFEDAKNRLQMLQSPRAMTADIPTEEIQKLIGYRKDIRLSQIALEDARARASSTKGVGLNGKDKAEYEKDANEAKAKLDAAQNLFSAQKHILEVKKNATPYYSKWVEAERKYTLQMLKALPSVFPTYTKEDIEKKRDEVREEFFALTGEIL